MTLKLKNIVKILLALFLVDMFIFPVLLKRTFPMVTEITTILSIAMVFLECIYNRSLFDQIWKVIMPMMVFVGYLLVSGCILMVTRDYDITQMISAIEMVALMIIVAYIVLVDGNFNYIAFLGIGMSVILSIYTVLNRDVLIDTLNDRLELSGTLSPNTTGLMMTFGVLGTYLIKSKYLKNPVKIIINVLCVYVIILTASRQALLITAAIYFCWFWRGIKMGKTLSRKKKAVVFFGAIAAVALVVYVISSGALVWILETKLFNRVNNNDAGTVLSDQVRANLYRYGLREFLDSPLIGCGYDNLEQYTHSTYIEILSGTGMLGTLVFYSPLLYLVWKSARKLKYVEGAVKNVAFDTLVIMAVLFIMMFFRMINYYIISQMILTLVFAGDCLSDCVKKNDMPETAERLVYENRTDIKPYRY